MTKLLLNITNPTPVKAINEPSNVPREGRSLLYMMPTNMVVKRGDIEVMSDTFETNVYSRAVFSAMK
jgi:hypothetical protein